MNAVNRKTKALEPRKMFCAIKKKKVTVLFEYSDYRNRHFKGAPDTCYCECIISCYNEGVRCRYSGISPLYPDPLTAEEIK